MGWFAFLRRRSAPPGPPVPWQYDAEGPFYKATSDVRVHWPGKTTKVKRGETMRPVWQISSGGETCTAKWPNLPMCKVKARLAMCWLEFLEPESDAEFLRKVGISDDGGNES